MPRFHIGLPADDASDKELWQAANVTAEAAYLVNIELSFDGQDPNPLERYKSALLALGKEASHSQQLSRYNWIFKLDMPLNVAFQSLVDHLGVEHHSYTAVDLKSGEGLAYDAEKRVVCEFYSQNWEA